MYTKDAVAYFGSRAEIARRLKHRTKSAVYQWGELVPILVAHELAALSEGSLRVEVSLYERAVRKRNQAIRAAS